ncbi:MAG: alanyl-tRNA editing protein [Deltaproteobacteria bacterium]|nr:alanyl-tRNA editing protein [Deltaproteobacteria bacterium]
MPDEKLFYEDPTLERIETEVIETGDEGGRPWARLERTIFHPEGGGQPADWGALGDVPVVNVQEREGRVLHFVNSPVAVGPVVACLDAGRRFDLSQQHTAQHLLTAVLLERHGLPTTAFHLGESYAAIEVDGKVPDPEALAGFEDEVNAIVREARTVRTLWIEPGQMKALGVRSRMLPEGHTGKVRIVEIEGVDINTCGGTHVQNLSEIQMIHIFHAEPARGGARIHFLAGGRILSRLGKADALEAALKDRLGTSPMDFARVVDGWLTERRRLKKRVKRLEDENAEHIARELALTDGDRIEKTIQGAGPDMLRSLAKAVLELRPEAVVSLVGEAEVTCFIVQSGPAGPQDVSDVGEALRDRLKARGGGKGRTFQGRT